MFVQNMLYYHRVLDGEPMKYKIYEISVLELLRYADRRENRYIISFDEDNTMRCISMHAPQTQDDCALFYQTMLAVYGDNSNFAYEISDKLQDIIFYADFSGIFDRKAVQKKYRDRQDAARDMFRPEGIELDFGRGKMRYRAFERSGSMSRNSRLSFIRSDYYDAVRNRIMLGMNIGVCQLSKLYAYNGLMLTSGCRIDMNIWNPERVVIVENPVTPVYEANIITVEDDGNDGSMRKYHRVEKKADLEVTEFDGEGIISPAFAKSIDEFYCGRHIHSSFQIRMPYIKGIVHEVNIQGLYDELSVPYIVDVWGVKHSVENIDLILTESMFKGKKWMEGSGLTWHDYIERCREYRHALYISGVNQVKPSKYTQLNYQFLNTAPMTADEFRPMDLPKGWNDSPDKDERHWLTKYTEAVYYGLVADKAYRREYFTKALSDPESSKQSILDAELIEKNPLFINEPKFVKELSGKAEKLLADYSVGRLLIPGDNRYLSGDLIRLLELIIPDEFNLQKIQLEFESLRDAVAYAPGAAYPETDNVTLLRNPHIARNEEAMAATPKSVGYFRKKYLSHLSYVVMVDSRSLIPDRLGGADFDGDMIKTIADPLLNECVERSYHGDHYDPYNYRESIPLLKIPTVTPQLRDASDWEACFETIRSTFSTRIGQICNAAFDRSIVAYNENIDNEVKDRLKQETEMLEILTGLEIDSVKNGIKPDLSEYLGKRIVARSPFLKYKNLLDSEDERAWYAPTRKQKLEKYFESVDWESISSNVERLPMLAKELKENTPALDVAPAKDEELFTFAKKKDWNNKLPADVMNFMASLIADYEEAVQRIRRNRHLPEGKLKRKTDIERILFARGQENDYSADELYAVFKYSDPKMLDYYLTVLKETQWQFQTAEERQQTLRKVLPFNASEDDYAFFSDFRQGGYRIIGDILCDLIDANALEERKAQGIHHVNDSNRLRIMLENYEKHGSRGDYEEQLLNECRKIINMETNRMRTTAETMFACAAAHGERDFALRVMPETALKTAVKRRDKNA